ncbi:MAG: TonB-dependent receptor [Prevotellaceae bacterium]|jgi:TonB-linked SusC/RagA family outer membrane protein|nr:TonB-dependent receptor [Prevotellaceae bacterium]
MYLSKIFENKPVLLTGLLSLYFWAFAAITVEAQNLTVTGKILDSDGNFMTGVTVLLKGTNKGVTSDETGGYTITNVPRGGRLEFRLVGFVTVEKEITGDKLNVIMIESSESLEEVTVVAFGKQKKESVISSITTVNTRDLKVPSSNLTTAFAGRIAGMISYQTSGEPGHDQADFFIRGVTTFGAGKVDPLILIDNVELTTNDLSKLHPDDISSFSVLKDATATALYGARGANGVILVTTKEGREGKARITLRLENSFAQPTKKIEMSDPITYMKLANEAAATRNSQAPLPYSYNQIEQTALGANPYVYPAVDWMGLLVKDYTSNQRANLNISGGGTVARYYVAASFTQDNGILKVDNRNSFNNNINYKNYLIRSNININITKTTELLVRLHATFDDYQGPLTGGSDMYKRIFQVSPVRFPAWYEPDEQFKNAGHILFGGYGGSLYMNPYAEMLKGYRESSNSMMMAQMELKQDFGKWVKGLTGRALGNTIRNANFDLNRSYVPFFYSIDYYDPITNIYKLKELNPNEGQPYLGYSPGSKNVSYSFYGEGSLSYNRTFNEKHGVSGMLVGIVRTALTANAGDLPSSLPQRNLGLSGRFTYSYDNRYFSEFNFGYNGSEKFDKGHRWGFFPSIGLGYTVSNEKFWESIKSVVSKLKIRGTYGLVGNDASSSTRFFYLSNVAPRQGDTFNTGYGFGTQYRGMKISQYANPDVSWEISYKSNLGIELGLLDGKIEIQADLFKEHRINILQPRVDIPVEMGLWATPLVNVGEANGKGVDISFDYNHNISKDAWIVGRANFTYARSVYSYYEEPNYTALNQPYRSKIGHSVQQTWGYVAERLFIDQEDIDVSPIQNFGEYRPGDVKYMDINKDGKITEADMVPIGYPKIPEINYGFGISAGYKNFDISIFFQGSARSSFWIDAAAMSPFVQRTVASDGSITADLSKGTAILETGLAKFIANDYWTELSQNPRAGWPRLSNYLVNNNNQQSTWFMRDNNFLRLKSAEIGYELPRRWIEKINLTSCRFYINGTNLLLFSKFKLWDIEMGSNGLNYPLQRIINLGVNLSF